MPCYITHTGCFLPGEPVENNDMERYIGKLWGESKVKRKILAANRITQRYYAQDQHQRATYSVYEMAAQAIANCLAGTSDTRVTYLSAGSTNAPLVGPGLATVIHRQLSEQGILKRPVEINSNSGICSSAAQAFVNAYRAIELGNHHQALCVGSEHPSEILKSSVVRPHYDLLQMYRDVKKSRWFMTVFLRFMLSDGAGAMLLSRQAPESGIGYKVNWTFSQSLAHQSPRCMQLETRSQRLTQDIRVLSEHLGPGVRQFVAAAMAHQDDRLANYQCVLPHISSHFFTRELKAVMREQLQGESKMDFWTNLSTVGNTGSASMYVMLDEYTRTQHPEPGSKILLFVPESGQFNFVLISLTVVGAGDGEV